jgi:hypothetical protein
MPARYSRASRISSNIPTVECFPHGRAMQACQGGPSRGHQLPIAPPPVFVITTTEGRGGTPSASKSGQRVEGLSKVLPESSPGCWMARNSALSSGSEERPADLGAGRRLVEEPRQRAARPGGVGHVDAVGHAGRGRRAVGRDPDTALAVEGAVVRAGEPALGRWSRDGTPRRHRGRACRRAGRGSSASRRPRARGRLPAPGGMISSTWPWSLRGARIGRRPPAPACARSCW